MTHWPRRCRRSLRRLLLLLVEVRPSHRRLGYVVHIHVLGLRLYTLYTEVLHLRGNGKWFLIIVKLVLGLGLYLLLDINDIFRLIVWWGTILRLYSTELHWVELIILLALIMLLHRLLRYRISLLQLIVVFSNCSNLWGIIRSLFWYREKLSRESLSCNISGSVKQLCRFHCALERWLSGSSALSLR